MFAFPALFAAASPDQAPRAWLLPLPEHLAGALLRVFAEPVERRGELLTPLARGEAVLALWAVCVCDRWRQHPPSCEGELVAWLAHEALPRLQWAESPPGSEHAVCGFPADAAHYPLLAAHAVCHAEACHAEACHAEACRAEATGANANPANANPAKAWRAYLQGLLRDGADWFRAAPVEVGHSPSEAGFASLPPEAASHPRPLLPLWLKQPSVEPAATGALGGASARSFATAERVEAAWRQSLASDAATASRFAGLAPPAIFRRLWTAERLESRFAAELQQEKLAALRAFAYGASHEINNPLANISLRAQLLARDEPDPDRQRQLLTIQRQALRAHDMISNLMLYAKPPALVPGRVDLDDVVERVVAELAPEAARQRTRLVWRPPVIASRPASAAASVSPALVDSSSEPASPAPPSPAPPTAVLPAADATQLAVLARLLIENALEALGQGGEIEVALAADARSVDVRTAEELPAEELPAEELPAEELPAEGLPAEGLEVAAWMLSVRDTGPGLSDEALRHCFDPFYSGREAGRGLGLGLCKCWRIVTDHGGAIVVENNPGGGARVVARFPVADPRP